ncbi:MAG: peroxiredoxin [Sedimentisphaerales bacterium]|nr:peroxiredoxin [Sedimentisphaerales bacterium]
MHRLTFGSVVYLCCLTLVFAGIAFAAESLVALVLPAVGDVAPAFNANTDTGDLWQTADHVGKGKCLVVYFYPAAMTGGCTQQACSYRDQSAEIAALDAEVIGISADPVNSLKLFKRVHHLNFTLLSDVNATIARHFGVPIRDGGTFKTTVDGKEVALKRPYTLARWTFVIDKAGKVVHKDTNVNASADSDNIVKFLQNAER